MSFWSELSTPVKGVAIVGLVLIVVFGGYMLTSGEPDPSENPRGLQPPAAAQ